MLGFLIANYIFGWPTSPGTKLDVAGTVDANKFTTGSGIMTGGTFTYIQGSGWNVLFNSGHTAVGTLYVWASNGTDGRVVTSDFKVVYGSSNLTNSTHALGSTISAIDVRYNNAGYNAEVNVTSTNDVLIKWLFVGMGTGSY